MPGDVDHVPTAGFHQFPCSPSQEDRPKLLVRSVHQPGIGTVSKQPAYGLGSDEDIGQRVECGHDEHDPERESPAETRLRDPAAHNRSEHCEPSSDTYRGIDVKTFATAHRVPSMAPCRTTTRRSLVRGGSTYRSAPLQHLSKLRAIVSEDGDTS